MRTKLSKEALVNFIVSSCIFDSLNLIHTNQCTSSYKDVLIF